MYTLYNRAYASLTLDRRPGSIAATSDENLLNRQLVGIDQFRETFCADLPEAIAGPMAVSQRPLTAAAFTENATSAGWNSVPSCYLVSEKDNAIPPECERFMAQRAGSTTETVSGSHCAFIAFPEVVSSLIMNAVAAA